MNRTGEQWPTMREYSYSPTLFVLRAAAEKPNTTIRKNLSIPQLLEQADMVRMAQYDYAIGRYVTPTEKENAWFKKTYGLNRYHIYLYPKNHTFHELQPPTPNTERHINEHTRNNQ